MCDPGRLINLVHDVARIGDPDEDEVVVIGCGGVEIDVADLHDPLVDRLAVVDVLHPLQPRLLDLARDDATLDVEATTGDRVGRRHAFDEADEDGEADDRQHDQEDGCASGAEELGDHANDDGDQDALDVEAEDRPPGRMALDDHLLARAEVETHRRAGYPGRPPFSIPSGEWPSPRSSRCRPPVLCAGPSTTACRPSWPTS